MVMDSPCPRSATSIPRRSPTTRPVLRGGDAHPWPLRWHPVPTEAADARCAIRVYKRETPVVAPRTCGRARNRGNGRRCGSWRSPCSSWRRDLRRPSGSSVAPRDYRRRRAGSPGSRRSTSTWARSRPCAPARMRPSPTSHSAPTARPRSRSSRSPRSRPRRAPSSWKHGGPRAVALPTTQLLSRHGRRRPDVDRPRRHRGGRGARVDRDGRHHLSLRSRSRRRPPELGAARCRPAPAIPAPVRSAATTPRTRS